MFLWPNKKQWKNWSLPSKYTFIGFIIGTLALGLYIGERSYKIWDWVTQDSQTTAIISEINVGLQFPYERVGGAVKQNKRNPTLKITNVGSKTIAPIKADVTVFNMKPSLDGVQSAIILSHQDHGHSIFEPELKPGLSVSISLPGIRNWVTPVVYGVRAKVFIPNEKKIPPLSRFYLVDKDGIKAQGSKLSTSITEKIKRAIIDFKEKGTKKQFTVSVPLDGIYLPHAEPGVNLKMDEDGTLTVK